MLRIPSSRLPWEFARFVSRSGHGWQSGIAATQEGLIMRGQADEPAVVTLPAEIEQDSAGLATGGTDSVLDGAGPAYAALREAVASGVPVVVADLTGTTFCDYPGFHQLVAIHRLAAISDVQLRLAMPAEGTVRRWLEFLAYHRLVRSYPGLKAATTA